MSNAIEALKQSAPLPATINPDNTQALSNALRHDFDTSKYITLDTGMRLMRIADIEAQEAALANALAEVKRWKIKYEQAASEGLETQAELRQALAAAERGEKS